MFQLSLNLIEQGLPSQEVSIYSHLIPSYDMYCAEPDINMHWKHANSIMTAYLVSRLTIAINLRNMIFDVTFFNSVQPANQKIPAQEIFIQQAK